MVLFGQSTLFLRSNTLPASVNHLCTETVKICIKATVKYKMTYCI